MSCHFKQRNIGATMRYFLQVEEGNENDLEAAVATQGPISVVVDASHNIFRVCNQNHAMIFIMCTVL